MKTRTGSVRLPPTDADLLQIAANCCPREFKALHTVFDQVWQGREPPPHKYNSMEQLFAACYLRVQQTYGTSRIGRATRDLFDKLIGLLRDTLSATTGKAHSHQHLDLFRRLMRAKPAEMNLVTFNYDVLADRALRAGESEGLWSWNHLDGYGFSPSGKKTPNGQSNVLLLKLHGSMNWYIPVPGRTRVHAYNPSVPVYIQRGSPGSA